MHIVDALAGETGCYLLTLLLDIEHQGQKALDIG
jgi:hypothetical protein